MKKTSKLLALLLAFVMAFAVVTPAVKAADVEQPATKTNTVTLHKLLMSKDDLASWDSDAVEKAGYDGSQNLQALQQLLAGKTLKEIKDVYFALKFANDYDNNDLKGKYVKAADDNKLTPAQPLQATKNVEEAVGGLTQTTGVVFNTANLSGKFEIVEIVEKSTYMGDNGELLAGQKAVPVEITLPLVNEKGVVAEAHVYPKNTETKPQIDKNFLTQPDNATPEQKKFYENLSEEEKQALGADYNKYQSDKKKVSQDLGTVIPYDVITSIKAGSRYHTLNWKDTMTNGLTYNKNLEIKATYGTNQTLTLVKDNGSNNGDYKLTEDDRGFTLSFTEAGFAKLNAITHPENGAGQDVEFKLTYSATVNKNAVVDTPESNDIKLEYSNEKTEEKDSTPVTPSNNQLNVTKTWANGESNVVPEGVKVVYTLTNGTTTVAVMLDGTKTQGTIDLGHGITFEITGKYDGTFKGLTGNGWKLSERVSGYKDAINGTTTGSAAITNTKDNENPEPLNPTEPKVEYYGKKFVKADENTGARLEGAQFVVTKQLENKTVYLALKTDAQNTAAQQALTEAKNKYTTAVDAWNKAVADGATTVTIENQQYTVATDRTTVLAKIAELKEAYDNAFYAAADAYEWVEDKEATNLVVLVSDVQGKFEIKGLEAGNYTLVEIKAPEGYALPTNATFAFEVGPNSYTTGTVKYEGAEAVQDNVGGADAQRVNNKKVSIPQTGGMGTVIFTVAGIVIMAAAGFVLVKNNKKEIA